MTDGDETNTFVDLLCLLYNTFSSGKRGLRLVMTFTFERSSLESTRHIRQRIRFVWMMQKLMIARTSDWMMKRMKE